MQSKQGIVAQGKDALAPFVVRKNHRLDAGAYTCVGCNSTPELVVHYLKKLAVSEYVEKAPSFIMRSRSERPKGTIRIIGLTCGCYAKVHRQICHIERGEKKAG